MTTQHSEYSECSATATGELGKKGGNSNDLDTQPNLPVHDAFKFFLSRCSDQKAGEDTIARWLTAVGFDPALYLHLNPDVADAGIDPLSHYIAWGFQQKRRLAVTTVGNDEPLWRVIIRSSARLSRIVKLDFTIKTTLLQQYSLDQLRRALGIVLQAGPQGMFGSDFGLLVCWLALWAGEPAIAESVYRTYAFGLPEASPLDTNHNHIQVYSFGSLEMAGAHPCPKFDRPTGKFRSVWRRVLKWFHSRFRTKITWPELLSINDALIVPEVAKFFTGSGFVVNPLAISLTEKASIDDTARPPWKISAGNFVLVDAHVQHVARAVILTSTPRETELERCVGVLQLATALGKQAQNYEQVLSTYISPFGKTLLEACCPRIKHLLIKEWTHVSDASFIIRRTNLFNNTNDLSYLRSIICPVIKNNILYEPSTAQRSVFIKNTNSSSRRLHNSIVVERYLIDRKFEVLDAGTADLSQQMTTLNSCNFLIGDCGDLVGALFCRESIKVLAIVNPGKDELYEMLKEFSRSIGFDLHAVEALPTSLAADGPSKSDHILNLKVLQAALSNFPEIK